MERLIGGNPPSFKIDGPGSTPDATVYIGKASFRMIPDHLLGSAPQGAVSPVLLEAETADSAFTNVHVSVSVDDGALELGTRVVEPPQLRIVRLPPEGIRPSDSDGFLADTNLYEPGVSRRPLDVHRRTCRRSEA